MAKTLILWATPRSTSTAFFQMMKTRGDFLTCFEPFSLSFYGSRDRISRRFAHLPPQPEHDYDVTLRRIVEQAKNQSIFIKDMASHVIHRADETFLSHFKSTFIIRHPAKMLPSLLDRWPDFSLQETGYMSLYELFRRVKEINGKTPPVIDSDELIQNAPSVVKAYCAAVRIPFLPESLTWDIDPEKTTIGLWNDGDAWFTYLKTTKGFQERPRRNYESIEDNPHLQQAYEACMPYYEKMYAQRLLTTQER